MAQFTDVLSTLRLPPIQVAEPRIVGSWRRAAEEADRDWSLSSHQLEAIALELAQSERSGSLVVVLRRSPIGESAKRRRILRSLGLKRLNQVITGPNEGWFTGQVRKVLDLVYVDYLDVDSRVQRLRRLDVSERMFPYPDGQIAMFPEGQYLQVEVNDGQTSVLWPSLKPVDAILTDLIATTGVQEERRATVGFNATEPEIEFDPETDNPNVGPGGSETTDLSGLAQILRDGSDRVAYIDIDMPEFLFTWTRHSRKFEVDGQSYPEVGMTFKRLPKSLDAEFLYIERTATPEVGEHAVEVLRGWPLLMSGHNGR